jgi:hypothetical protein
MRLVNRSMGTHSGLDHITIWNVLSFDETVVPQLEELPTFVILQHDYAPPTLE